MENKDIRWKQRFQNFAKALTLLEEAVKLSKQRKLTDLENQGLIQRFEFTHELAWNVMKDYLTYQGEVQIIGSRDAIRLAFRRELIQAGKIWMDMIESRIKSVHTYDEEIANALLEKIVKQYYPLFVDFKNAMDSIE